MRLVVRVTDTWNQAGRKGGLKATVRIFNQRKRLSVGRVHANRKATFTARMPRGAANAGTYYVGISAAGNDRYKLDGTNGVAAAGASNQGTYQVSFEIVSARPGARNSRIVFL